MRNAALSWAVRGLVPLVISVVCLPTTSRARPTLITNPPAAG